MQHAPGINTCSSHIGLLIMLFVGINCGGVVGHDWCLQLCSSQSKQTLSWRLPLLGYLFCPVHLSLVQKLALTCLLDFLYLAASERISTHQLLYSLVCLNATSCWTPTSRGSHKYLLDKMHCIWMRSSVMLPAGQFHSSDSPSSPLTYGFPDVASGSENWNWNCWNCVPKPTK